MAVRTQVSGVLVAIATGARTNVWGVNASGEIYRCTSNDASSWVVMPGAGADIRGGDRESIGNLPQSAVGTVKG
ncbi:hypothetical protein ACWD0J_26100 [Streptomyces sp. NPDC003011]